jgi:hypothetical protein
MALIQSDSVDITPSSGGVTFPVPMGSADYVVVFTCVSQSDASATIACSVGSYTVNGFTVTVSEDAVFSYIASESGAALGTIAPLGRLSRDWTAQRLWAEGVRDLGVRVGDELLPFERFTLVNRTVNAVAQSFYPILANAYKTEVGISQSGDKISLAGIRFAMAGSETGLIVESTVSSAVVPLAREAFTVFRTSAFQNIKTIAFCYNGDYLYLKKGSGLATYGTLTLRYPRVPIPVTADTDLVDLPDSCMEIAILKLKTLLMHRRPTPEPEGEIEQEMTEHVRNLYSQLGVQATLEEIKDKAVKVL